MKALLLAAAFAILSTSSMAGASRSDNPLATVDRTTATLLADAGRLGSASLTALNGSHWAPAELRVEPEAQFDALNADIDVSTLVLGLVAAGILLFRPVGRTLRRHERQRRAAALASTLPRR